MASCEPIQPRRRLTLVGLWWFLLAFVSGLGWLVAQAASMSGSSFVGALDRDTLVTVLTKTQFGTMPHAMAWENQIAVAEEVLPYFRDRVPAVKAGAKAAAE